MESAAKFSILLRNLSNAKDKLSIMTDIIIYLRSLHSNQLSELSSTETSFDILFEYLTEGELCKTTCKALDLLLSSVRPDILFKTHQQHLLDGLKHPSSDVRLLCCCQLKRLCDEEEYMVLIVSKPEFVQLVIDCVCDESESSGPLHKAATSVLCKIGTDKIAMETLFSISSPVFNHLKNRFISQSSTVWFRLMEVVVNCCSVNPEASKICQTNLLLHLLIDKVRNGSDVLSCSVAIETLTSFACSEHGYRWLVTQDVLADLVNALDNEDVLFCTLIHPVILKFFAKVSTVFPENIFDDNLPYLTKVCALIVGEETSDDLLVNAIDALTGVASTSRGKLVLHKLGATFTNAIRRIGHIAQHTTLETQLVCLHCMGELMSAWSGDVMIANAELEELCEAWFMELGEQPLEFLLKVSKNPIPEGRLAVHKIYTGLATQEWAQKMMRDHPTFCEYLLDRNTEKEEEGWLLKHTLITSLLDAPTLGRVFPAAYIMKLKVYKMQGPLYVQAESQVATEEG